MRAFLAGRGAVVASIAMALVDEEPEDEVDGDDEEDEDTVETRRSVKTVEKRMKHRFFINARERKDYEE